MIKNKENRGFLEFSWNLMGCPTYPNLIITDPPELVMVKLLLDVLVVVLITGEATFGSNIMPSVVPLTTNFLDGDVVPMPTLPFFYFYDFADFVLSLVTVPKLPIYLFALQVLNLLYNLFLFFCLCYDFLVCLRYGKNRNNNIWKF